ncbi:MAG: helicase [Demequinaceae bacterium]|nr:helicase [Demequinaceae bacterium]
MTSLVFMGVVAVVATLVVALGAVGAVAVAGSRAQGAADACALAAASEARDLRALGQPMAEDPCNQAAAVAEEWGGILTECSIEADGIATVRVETRTAGIQISRSARAGTG